MSQAPKPHRDTVVDQGLMREMVQAEFALNESYEVLLEAQTGFEVASLKYAALRDILEGRLGRSPYLPHVPWPDDIPELLDPFSYGRWKYIHKRIGQATVEVLQNREALLEGGVRVLETGNDNPGKEMGLTAICGELAWGGLEPPKTNILPNPRAVNAALINSNHVQKTEDGRYFLAPVNTVLPSI